MVSEGNDRQERPKTRKNLPRRDLGVPARLEAMKFTGQCGFSVFSSKLSKPSLEKGSDYPGKSLSYVVYLPLPGPRLMVGSQHARPMTCPGPGHPPPLQQS